MTHSGDRARCVGLVLAGGPGARLGRGIAKPLVPLEGRTLLERAIEILRPVADEVLVAAPQGADLGTLAVEIVHDVPGLRGPLAGIVAAMEARQAAAFAVLGVDHPLVRPELLRELLARLRPGIDAVVPRRSGRAQPLAAAYAAAAREPLRRAIDEGERSMHGAFSRLAIAWIEDTELATLPGGIESLLNVNLPEDLERAESLLRSARAANEGSTT